MTNQKNPWAFDLRIRDRNLQQGLLGPKELEEYLETLPDVAENSEAVSVPQPVAEEDGAKEGEKEASGEKKAEG